MDLSMADSFRSSLQPEGADRIWDRPGRWREILLESLEEREIVILAGGEDAEREVSMMAASRLSEAMKAMGLLHRVASLEQLLALISGQNSIIVFNVLYGPFGEGGAVAGLMDCLDIPCVYSQAGPSAISLDKWRCQLVLEGAGVSTSRGMPFESGMPISDKLKLNFPVVLKPLKQGSSVNVSVVYDESYMGKVATELCSVHGGGMVEEYLEGAEYSVGVLEMPDGSLRALPPIAVEFLDGHMIASSSVKYGDGLSLTCPASGDQDLLLKLQCIAKMAFQVIGCSQVARVDFRCDSQGCPRVLEINHHPGMTDHSWLPIAADKAGICYEDLVAILLDTAMKRRRVSARFKASQVSRIAPISTAGGQKCWLFDGEYSIPSAAGPEKVYSVSNFLDEAAMLEAPPEIIDAIYDDKADCTELRAALDALGYRRIGMSILSSALSIDKLTQRYIASALKIPQPAYTKFDENVDPCSGNPVVLKKRFSNQSRDVYLVSKKNELIKAAAGKSSASQEWLIEDYAPGDEIHLIMGKKGGAIFVSELARIPGKPFPWLLDNAAKSDPAAIILAFDVPQSTRAILLPLCRALFHAFDSPPICRIEWRVSEKNEVKFIEFDGCPGLGKNGLAARILSNSGLIEDACDWAGFLC
ncbi:hypothetical protein MO327_18755 [Xanthomonas translucens]|uniref:hypothetical protein n=1 Tax=Xanthomonas campestris pv. translucens TaxID=343 RepID=UPI00272A0A82|nr:hypothetical protein [Xanthomonas translucens]WLA12162.1 hypothetical protein MO327_18755 [Xanthomonas translucens]